MDKVKLGRGGSDKAFELKLFGGPTFGAYCTSDGDMEVRGFWEMLDSFVFHSFSKSSAIVSR